ncbi:GmrSD restriction endonuclease domain-containing protein [Chryseobacterium koreense]|uniref:GmrSD restriction endonucleases N-terminal domain-containing protein n=1 Tax=Chryseobacterium koreense CCUG 49689 TaxID=1304281 RepID=A0A0J7J053_9FLAO|nr:DUF262 domain-containing protein [Chryseobacterium koreense]KMQ71451.1 hypothetical protein ACM44_06355 [Chryseobacterium koreense CCUG 49689]MBB5333711.1 hypothetical protein [Chryseobacterium koreense]
MATLFKDVKYNLQGLINNIDMGTIGLPDIQRPFVWPDTKVRQLFDSLYKGYPVGYLLFWENANINGIKSIGTEKKQRAAQLLIVDGQQRLTSLYAVIKGQEVIRENYTKTKIVIAFNPLEEKFEVPDAAIRRDPRYFQNISEVWKADADIFEITDEYIENLRKSRELSADEVRTIRRNFNNLKNLETYPFSVLELSQEIDEEQVADVFVRINSQGKTLNQADFILTLMSVFWDEGRTNLEEFCRAARLPSTTNGTPFNYIIVPKPDQMLRAAVGLAFRRARLQYIYSILRGKDLETGLFSEERRDQQFERLKVSQAQALDITNWHEFLKAIKQAGYSNESFISSNNNILYSYVFFLIGRIDYKVDLYLLKKLIARWFFMCSITGRYTGSPETAMEMDLAKLRSVNSAEEFLHTINEIIDSQLTKDFWEVTLPMDLATSSFRSPSLFAYYASLNIHDAYGLFSKLKVNELLQSGLRANKSALERHHLFPKAWLMRNGITEQRDYNQIANFALVEWSDNIAISDKEPKVYLPFYEERFVASDLERMKYWHALPENWQEMEYREFLAERRKRIANVVEDAFGKL